MLDDQVLLTDAFSMLRDEDPAGARLAELAYECLTGDSPGGRLGLRALQDFLWRHLPLDWEASLAEKLAAAATLGRLFTLLELPLYARTCADPITVKIIETYARDGADAGHAAYRRATRDAGVEPPAVAGLFSWGLSLGPDEAAAYWEVAAALEMALVAGDLKPGRARWRDEAERVTRATLTRQRPELRGGRWLDVIHAERLGDWSLSGGEVRAGLLTEIGDRLAAPAPVPPDAEHLLAPVRWLLARAVAGGVAVTTAGNLSRSIVAEGSERFGWAVLTTASRIDAEGVEARTLRAVGTELGAVRRSGRRLVATATGRELAAAPSAELWRATVPSLVPDREPEATAAEVALALDLRPGAAPSYREETELVAAVLAEAGWSVGGDPGSPEARRSGWLAGETHRRLGLLGLHLPLDLSNGPVGFLARPALSEAGLAAAVTALRARALRPPGA